MEAGAGAGVSSPEAPDTAATGGERPAKRRGKSRWVRPSAALAVIGLSLVVAGVAVWPDNRETFEITAGSNIAVTARAGPLEVHNSPALAVSPVDADVLVVANRVDRPEFGAAVSVSRDGGRSWTDLDVPLPTGEERAYAPDVAFASDGRAYLAFITLTGDGNNPSGVWLSRSDNSVSSFDDAVRVAGPYGYQPRVAVAGDGERVHVTWVQATAAVENVSGGFGPPPNPVMMATSADGGRTFDDAVQVSEPDRQRVGAATPVTGTGDRVFVLYQDFGDARADFEGAAGSVPRGPFALVLAQSTDGGATFSTHSVPERDVTPGERVNPYTPRHPSLAVAPDGDDVYVAWTDYRDGDADVFVRRSADGGRRWGGAVRVHGRTGSQHQYLPAVSVSPDGRVDVAYFDRAGDGDNVLTGVSLAASFDHGKKWVNLAVSDTRFDGRVGPGSERDTPDYGSRLGLVSGRRGAHVVWTDTRHGTLDTDKQDLHYAPVRILTD